MQRHKHVNTCSTAQSAVIPSSLFLLCLSALPLTLLMQGTVYQKTDAELEMKKINREEFWEQAKVGMEHEKESRGKQREMVLR